MELLVQPSKGAERVISATPEAVEQALRELGTDVEFIICSDSAGRFMQDNGEFLEYGENLEGQESKLLRADAGDVRKLGSLPALLSFIAGTAEWREQYEWSDVTDELPSRSGVAALVTLTLIVVAALIWLLA